VAIPEAQIRRSALASRKEAILMKIANGIEMLEISSNVLGKPRTVHPTLITDNGPLILVDAGFPGQTPLIRDAINEAGASLDQLAFIILTHHDIDHIGSLAAIQRELDGRVSVLAYKDEQAYIDGERTPLKLAQMEAHLSTLPDEMRTTYLQLKAAFEASRTRVDQTLTDGEELPYGGGLTVIHTPGHTLGHICLYVKRSKILIAGDALAVEEGALTTAPLSANYDMALCRSSLKKLAGYDIASVICYHGGLYQDRPNERIAALAMEADGPAH
jgi:glyoxylase-like metal-dependent hydrolase (beta-lactamase superfamily II)